MSHSESLPKEAGFFDSTEHFQGNVRISDSFLICMGNEHLGCEGDFPGIHSVPIQLTLEKHGVGVPTLSLPSSRKSTYNLTPPKLKLLVD